MGSQRVVLETTIYRTTDKKKLKGGIKEYEYGAINLRDSKLKNFVGKRVKINLDIE